MTKINKSKFNKRTLVAMMKARDVLDDEISEYCKQKSDKEIERMKIEDKK